MVEVKAILEQGVAEGLHLGAQIEVVHGGAVVLSFACGEARSGAAMMPASITPWYSAGKPLTAVAIALLHERGKLRLEEPVAHVIPEFARAGKEAVTFLHLLTHTAGFRSADKIAPATPWVEMIERICETPMEEGWTPGEKAGYSTQAAWFILAEAIQRASGVAYEAFMRTELFEPLGMRDAWMRLPFAKYREYGERVALMYDTSKGGAEPVALQDAEGMAICRPGASARGPVRDLTNFYAMLLAGGLFKGRRILHSETVASMRKRHREGMFDQTFMHKLDFGLGLILDSKRPGADTVPYGYGAHASEEAFGHSGAQSSCAFADPRHGLVVAWVTNGQPGERKHQTRQRAINTAIYEALGLGGQCPPATT